MSKLDKDAVLEKFNNAYKAANGKLPEIDAGGGWYSVDGGKKVRLAQLDEMADKLTGSGESTAEPKAESKLAEEPAPKAKKTAKPKASKPKASKALKSFSVKDFYAAEILSKKPGSISPR